MTDENFEKEVEERIRNPKNLGEMTDADGVGTVGSPGCGDMVRMWVKFREEDGRKVIDRASFQTFGCQTAIAVASMATEMIAGKTREEALSMKGDDLAAPLGPLPPMRIHCAQLVEDALRSALAGEAPEEPASANEAASTAPTLLDQMNAPAGKMKIQIQNEDS